MNCPGRNEHFAVECADCPAMVSATANYLGIDDDGSTYSFCAFSGIDPGWKCQKCDVTPRCHKPPDAEVGIDTPQEFCRGWIQYSVLCFAAQQFTPFRIEHLRYLLQYPLPIGALAIKRWLEDQHKYFGLDMDPPHAWLTKNVAEHGDALLGLALSREVRLHGHLIGHIWLLDWWKRCEPSFQ